MRVLTVVRLVPDSRATVKVAGDGSGIETRGLKFVCDPFDEFGVEQAIRLKEQRDDVSEVVAITVGPAGSLPALHHALAMGADRGIHVRGDWPGHDELLLAEALAAAIQRDDQGFDLILTGKQSIDNDAGELGPALAEFLGLPHVGAVVKLEITGDDCLRASRRIEGADEVVESPLPALITCEKGLVEPRYPALPNIIKAKKKPVEVVEDLEGVSAPRTRLVELSPPAARPECTIIEGEPAHMAKELARLLREEAKVI